jgi:lysine-N-methylase
MKVLKPEYFYQFQCIASACPDSCCKEWEVDVDDTAASFYRNLEGPLGDHLRQVLKDTEDGTVMTIKDGRCPMWRQDGLCRIQAEMGHDALCQVCRDFPRLRHDYGDFVEYGLELSCPEAARLILTQSHTLVAENAPGEDEVDYDPEIMAVLLETRKTALDFLDNTSLPVNLALAVLLLYVHEVQSWIDGADVAVLDEEKCVNSAKKYAANSNWALVLEFFQNLEILTPQWHSRLSAPIEDSCWHSGFLSLAKYFIGRYWLQAVADFDLISRVKLLVSACLLVYRLGGDFLETAQLFSKEIENDPDNLETILDGTYTSPALTDIQLLSLLLNG